MAEVASCIRDTSERDIAIALVLVFAEQEFGMFSMMRFYDEDAEFIQAVADRLKVGNNLPFTNKMKRVVRRLVRYNVLYARTMSTGKEYIGEPSRQRNYGLRPDKAGLIRRGETDCTMDALGGTEFLLRHAYPREEMP